MPKNLYRSRTNKVFTGVCGGIAEYFEVDPIIIRLLWVIAIFMGGTGLFLYLLAIIIIPKAPCNPEEEKVNEEGINEEKHNQEKHNQEKRKKVFGAFLIFLGGCFLLEKLFPTFNFHNWWPLLLIALGIFLLYRGREELGDITRTTNAISGLLCIYFGILFLLNTLEIVSRDFWYTFISFWPLLLIVLGVRLVFYNNNKVQMVVYLLTMIIPVVYCFI